MDSYIVALSYGLAHDTGVHFTLEEKVMSFPRCVIFGCVHELCHLSIHCWIMINPLTSLICSPLSIPTFTFPPSSDSRAANSSMAKANYSAQWRVHERLIKLIMTMPSYAMFSRNLSRLSDRIMLRRGLQAIEPSAQLHRLWLCNRFRQRVARFFAAESW